MKKKRFNLFLLLTAIALLILAACGADGGTGTKGKDNSASSDKPASDIKLMSLLTGGTQGTYYALGGTFADFITTETGIKTTAEVSQASAANMNALEAGKGEIAFVQTDIAYYATEGKLMFKKKIDTIAALGALYPETVQLVTTEASGIKSYADLKGKRYL